MERICIYPKDIQAVTGSSGRYGRNLIKKIRKKFSKKEHQFVTIEEFCSYAGLDVASVKNLLRD